MFASRMHEKAKVAETLSFSSLTRFGANMRKMEIKCTRSKATTGIEIFFFFPCTNWSNSQ